MLAHCGEANKAEHLAWPKETKFERGAFTMQLSCCGAIILKSVDVKEV